MDLTSNIKKRGTTGIILFDRLIDGFKSEAERDRFYDAHFKKMKDASKLKPLPQGELDKLLTEFKKKNGKH